MEKLTKESITIKSEGNSNNISKSMNKIKGVNDDLKIQKTSGFYDAMTGIIEFVTKDYVKELFKDNHLPDIFDSDIEDIETIGIAIMVKLKNDYTYFFKLIGNEYKLIFVSNDTSTYYFGEEGIDKLYSLIPARDRAGDLMDITKMELKGEDRLYVEINNVTYTIDCNTDEILWIENDRLGIKGIDNFIDNFASEYANNKRNKDMNEIKDQFHLSTSDITSITVENNIINICFSDTFYLTIEELTPTHHQYYLRSENCVYYDTMNVDE